MSVRAAIEATLAAIDAANPALNAFTTVTYDRARARAAAIDAALGRGERLGALAGMPFAAKNLFDVAGFVTRAGAKVTADDPPASADAAAVAALEAAGAVLVGMTNMDEFAYGFTTENAHDGPTHNPHDLARIAGGSSGGSAAAVAAGLVTVALASDTNGSIRVPAALCGIFGLRPTLGGVPTAGAFPFVNSSDMVGPFARTARDLALAYGALAGNAPVEDGARPRVASLSGYFTEAQTSAVRDATARVAVALGTTETAELGDARLAREAAFVITAAEAGELHAERLRARGADFDPKTRDRLLAGALVPAAWYIRAQRFRSLFRDRLRELFTRYDVLLAPATPYAATRIGETHITIEGVAHEIRPNVGVFTQPITLAGVPVVTVPIVEPGALPVGVQLIGPPHSEPMLLALAARLEAAGAVGAGAIPSVAA